jgi:hypothetical protein
LVHDGDVQGGAPVDILAVDLGLLVCGRKGVTFEKVHGIDCVGMTHRVEEKVVAGVLGE